MGVLDKFLDAIKLNDDYDDDELLDDSILEEEDDYDDDFLDDDDDMEEKPKKKFFEKFSKKKTDEEEDYLDDEEPEKEPVKPAPAKVSAKTAAAKHLQDRNVFPDRHRLPRSHRCGQAAKDLLRL